MQKTYNFDKIGVEFNKHPVVAIAEEVENSLQLKGFNVSLVEYIKAKEGSKAAKRGFSLTPNLSDSLEDTLDDIGWLSVNEEIAGHFGEVTGSTELTHIVVKNDLSVFDVIDALSKTEYDDDDETDMLNKMKHLVDLVKKDEDPNNSMLVVAYDILRKALGWMAEKFLDMTEDFDKAGASQDSWGVDITANNDVWSDYEFPESIRGFQLKTLTRVASQGVGHMKGKEHPHLAYAWTKDGIVVGDMAEIEGTDNLASTVKKSANISSKTILKKSHNAGELKDYPRSARVIAWE